MVLYRYRKVKTIVIALAVGVAIVGPAIFTSMALALEPLYFCVVVLAYTFVAGKIIGGFRMKLARTPPPTLLPQQSEREIETMLQKRGLGKLVRKKRTKSGG